MASEIVPMRTPVDIDTLDMINKKKLLAPEHDNEAVARAAQDIRTYYTTQLFPPDDPFYRI
ncbi:hypothetical protein C8A00DRAFT_30953 [Chaetomidium leptoderma]|uniref:Uncharacterized protein n=1 Tax=Chaetomidium leptoderma TaxID=669021 RepID=A0AAN6ZZ46_9PEZI|nr:hypothetical protein C8A00DRAFT_30953 [Chaetomidium leptoderma]